MSPAGKLFIVALLCTVVSGVTYHSVKSVSIFPPEFAGNSTSSNDEFLLCGPSEGVSYNPDNGDRPAEFDQIRKGRISFRSTGQGWDLHVKHAAGSYSVIDDGGSVQLLRGAPDKAFTMLETYPEGGSSTLYTVEPNENGTANLYMAMTRDAGVRPHSTARIMISQCVRTGIPPSLDNP